MLVAVDIGNTNIVLGFLDGDTIAGTYRITTKANHTSDEYGLFLTEFLRMSGFQPSDVDDVIICSVVPKVMHSFRSSIVKFLDIDPMVVGPGSKMKVYPTVKVYLPERSRPMTTLHPNDSIFWEEFGGIAQTYRGHGTDKALVAGIMGMDSDDERIRRSLELAVEHGLDGSRHKGHRNMVCD